MITATHSGRMTGAVICVVLACSVWLVSGTGVSYVGGVALHTPAEFEVGGSVSASTVAAANVAMYAGQLAVASQHNVDMVVFPEFGISGGDLFGDHSSSWSAVREFAEPIPAPAEYPVTPCGNASFDGLPILQNMSCLAREHAVWAVVNMYDLQGSEQYNTDVVINSEGALVAKYWKSHVWFHSAFSEPSSPDLVSFTASFSEDAAPITFGMMICFDIAFHSPGTVLRDRGISQFPYSVSQGVVGPDVVALWSRLHNATVLAANDGGHVAIVQNGSQLPSKSVSTGTGNGNALVFATISV